MKKLSIITINYNNRDGLRKTIESVVAQTTRDFEYIVIDGGSTDGSVDVIREYADHIDYWVSEPDGGIYNAMNKGVRAASGQFCQFLNSGDWLYSNIVAEEICNHLTSDIDILTGNIVLANPDGRFECHKSSIPDKLSTNFFVQRTLPHQSTFIRTSNLRRRPYDESYKMVADWVFFFDSYLNDNIRYRRIAMNIACYDTTGISSSNWDQYNAERDNYYSSLDARQIVNDLKQLPYVIGDFYRGKSNSYKLRALMGCFHKIISYIYNKIFALSVKHSISNDYLPQFA